MTMLKFIGAKTNELVYLQSHHITKIMPHHTNGWSFVVLASDTWETDIVGVREAPEVVARLVDEAHAPMLLPMPSFPAPSLIEWSVDSPHRHRSFTEDGPAIWAAPPPGFTEGVGDPLSPTAPPPESDVHD